MYKAVQGVVRGAGPWASPTIVRLLLSNLIALICLLPSFAADSRLGWGTIEKLTKVLSVWTGNTQNKAVLNEVAHLIDYEGMAARTLGSYWSTLTPLEQREFSSVFRRLVEERYYQRWRKIFSRGELSYKEEVLVSKDLFVRTNLRVGKKVDKVIWRLSNRTGSYRIVSLAVDDKDLVGRLGERVQEHLREDGYAVLISWMIDKADLDEHGRDSART